MNSLVTCLDIGSSRMKCSAALISPKGNVKLLGLDSSDSKGVLNGTVVDILSASSEVSNILRRVEKKTGKKLKHIYVTVNDLSVKGFIAQGMIPLSKKGRQISARDINRCLDAALTVNIPHDRKIIYYQVVDYFLNECEHVRNPVGLYAGKLGVRVYIITANSANILNLRKCIENAGYLLSGVIFSGVAAGRSVIKKPAIDEQVLLLDIGSDVTGGTFFREFVIFKMISFKTGIKDLNSESNISDYVEKLAKSVRGTLFSKIIITGGGSLNDTIYDMLEKKLNVPCEMGVVRLNWCSLAPGDAIMHISTLGMIDEMALKWTNKAKETFLKRLCNSWTEFMDSYF